MFKFLCTTRCVNIASLILSSILFIIFQVSIEKFPELDFKKTFIYYLINQNEIVVSMQNNDIYKDTEDSELNGKYENVIRDNTKDNQEDTLDENQDNGQAEKSEASQEVLNSLQIEQNKSEEQSTLMPNSKWKIIIPSISLEAEIAEGTSKQVMNDYVGHFEETSKTIGNVALAAHNRGHPVNYFAKIKNLKEGDKVIYQYEGFQKTYRVTKQRIIKDTDWSVLEDTEENQLTLITCIENEPEYRRCVQATEEK